MPRKNPQVEALEHQNDILRKMIAEHRKDPGDMPMMGCGDHSCIVRTPTGQATNGGCRCEASELRRTVMWYKRRTKFLEETIRDLASQVTWHEEE